MFDRLPDWVDPARLAAQALEIKGFLPLAEMPRLSAALTDAEGEATARFRFGGVSGQPARLLGQVQARLHVQCQRCLAPMELPVEHEFEVRLVFSEAELAAVPDREDALEVEERGLSLHGLLEDELLLSLPVVALHAPGSACSAPSLREFSPEEAAGGGDDPSNPFAVLKDLKGKCED
ncbi:hypothetical protein B1C78_01105 [Thioalkalivibrio denitrificans]|uniref:Large ribosomal RNA subunit accumulation protein YceD n=1 Tax=Thioalkalivibrio denitrificans TaxID=108003 RepID=A0A1V3NU75_9GAMM|nr:YceD family protein [Thioalkalivibrio denitrificans]OOG28667.1 hypothetical protein B1C78_01105 [Thioalkalivibrio denitrificans]